MAESPDVEAKAVAENRMIPEGEEKQRAAISALVLVGVASWVKHKGGLAETAPGTVCAWIAVASTFAWTAAKKQCGCAIGCKWAVHGKPMMRKSTHPPEQYKDFMKGKQRGFFANMLGSAAIGVATTCGLYGLKGLLTKHVVVSATKAVVLELGLMVAGALLSAHA